MTILEPPPGCQLRPRPGGVHHPGHRKADRPVPAGVRPGIQGSVLYPPGGDLDRAKALARGNLRGGKAILYVPEFAQKASCGAALRRSCSRRSGSKSSCATFAEFPTDLGVPRPSGKSRRALGPGAGPLDARLRRRVRIHQPAAGRRGRRRHDLAGFDDATSVAKMSARRAATGRRPRTRLQRAGAGARPGCRARAADGCLQRGNPRLEARSPQLHAAAAGARPHDGVPEALAV